jgi:hypothetical protein
MKTLRIMTVLVVAATMLFAFAGVARAATEGDEQVYIYGQATQEPVVSILVSGGGESAPLSYQGESGTGAVPEMDGAQVIITNSGQTDADLYISAAAKPSDGQSQWSYANEPGDDLCVWSFDDADDQYTINVPNSGECHLGCMVPGQIVYLDSWFTFPSEFGSSNTFTMMAIVQVEECD